MKLKGYLLAAVAAAAYGTNPLFAIHLYEDGFNPNSVLFFRYVLGIPMLALLCWARGRSLRLGREDVAPVAILGVLMAVSSLALFESYNFINSGIASTLLFVYPIMVAMFMVFFFHERFKVMTGVALAVMAGGLYLLIRTDGAGIISPPGVLLVMVSSLTYAIYIVMVNVNRRIRGIPTVTLLFYVLLSGTGLFALMIPMGNPLMAPHTLAQWGNVLALALIPTVLSLMCTSAAINSIGPTPTAIFGAMEPVTALLLSVFALGQSITPRETVGVCLILVAATIVVASSRLEGRILHIRRLFPSLRRPRR